MIKTVKVDDGDEDNNEPEITDEELNEMLKQIFNLIILVSNPKNKII